MSRPKRRATAAPGSEVGRPARSQREVLAFLICFGEAIERGARGQAHHYLGSVEDLPARLQLYRDGRGARFLQSSPTAGSGGTWSRSGQAGS